MTIEARDAFAGLMTNVAETKAPPTALRVADNVVIRKPGAVEPRQGFAAKTVAYSQAGQTIRQGQAHGAAMVYEDATPGWRGSAAGTIRQERMTPNLAASTPAKFRADSFSTALARGNHYIPHSTGVAVANAATDTTWNAAGGAIVFHSVAGVGNTVTSPAGLAPNSRWSYRVVAKRKDANGMYVYSAPTGAVDVINNSGVNWISVQIAAAGWPATAWPSGATEYEFYRSRTFPSSVQADDEMALVATLAVHSPSGASLPAPTYYDSCQDSQRGQALYTSPSRGGIESANFPPPACFCMEPYRGHMFFGNTAGPQRFVVSNGLSDRTGQTTGVGWRDTTATVTAGSPTITVASATGLQKGMVRVTQGGISQGWITNIVGLTLTMSQNQAAPVGVGIAITFVDAIEVDGTWYPLTTNSGAGYDQLNTTIFEDLLAPVGTYAPYRLTPALSGYTQTHVIEHIQRNLSSTFTIRGTHGDEMSPALPLYAATALTSSKDVYPNALQWSKQEEPEHVPPSNYALVAEKTKAVLGLCATRDSLFIFKEDGIWRLSGYGGDWTIDPFDMTTFCVLPSSIRRLNNRIFMLSNKGVVAVSELGVEVLSFPVADQMRLILDDIRSNFTSLGYYQITGVTGVASYVDDRNSEYTLLLGTVALELGRADALVYNELSNAWTTFSFNDTGYAGFTPVGLGIDENGSPLVLHASGVKVASYATDTTLGQTTRRMYDGASQAVTLNSVTDNGDDTAAVVISVSQTPQAGFDVLVDASAREYEVITAASGTNFTVRLNSQVVPAGASTLYRGFPCVVQPHGYLGATMVGKFWAELAVGFSRLIGPVRLSSTFSSAEPLVREAIQGVTERLELQLSSGMAAHHLGTLARCYVPNDHQRAWLLRVSIEWLAIQGLVSLELLGLDSRNATQNRPQQNSTGL